MSYPSSSSTRERSDHSSPPGLRLMPLQSLSGSREVELHAGPVTIGSSGDCSVVLRIPGIAPRHVEIRTDGSDSIISAHDPRCWLNDGPLRTARLRSGDRLAIGPLEFRVEECHPFPLAAQTPQVHIADPPPRDVGFVESRPNQTHSAQLPPADGDPLRKLELIQSLLAELQNHSDQLRIRERELDQQSRHERRLLDQRQAAFEDEQSAARLELRRREQQLELQTAEHHAKRLHVAALEQQARALRDALDVREQSLAEQERQLAAESQRLRTTRLRDDDARIASADQDLRQARQQLQQREDELEIRARDLEIRMEQFAARDSERNLSREVLEAGQEASFAVEMQSKEQRSAVDARTADLDVRIRDLEERESGLERQAARLREEESRIAATDEELRRRRQELERREDEFEVRARSLDEDCGRLSDAEVVFQERLADSDVRESLLADRGRELEWTATELESQQRTFEAERSQWEQLRDELQDTRAELATRAARLQQDVEHLEQTRRSVAEAQLQNVAVLRDILREQRELQRRQDGLLSLRRELDNRRAQMEWRETGGESRGGELRVLSAKLEAERVELARDQAALQAQRELVDSERSTLRDWLEVLQNLDVERTGDDARLDQIHADVLDHREALGSLCKQIEAARNDLAPPSEEALAAARQETLDGLATEHSALDEAQRQLARDRAELESSWERFLAERAQQLIHQSDVDGERESLSTIRSELDAREQQLECRDEEIGRRTAAAQSLIEAVKRERELAREQQRDIAAAREKLQSGCEALEAERASVTAQQTGLREQFDLLRQQEQSLRELRALLEGVRDSVEESREGFEDRLRLLGERRAELDSAQQAFGERAAQIAERQRQLDDRERALAGREAESARESERVAAEWDAVQANQDELGRDRDDLVRQRQELDRRQQELDERTECCDALREELDERRAALDCERQAIDPARLRLAELQETVLSEREELEALQQELGLRESAVKEAQENVARREAELQQQVQELQNRIADCDDRDAANRAEAVVLKERREALDREQADISAARGDIESDHDLLLAERDKLEALRAELDAREAVLSRDGHEWERKDAELLRQASELEVQRALLDERERALEDRTRLIAQRQSAVETEQQELAAWSERLQTREGELADLLTDLESTRAELQQWERELGAELDGLSDTGRRIAAAGSRTETPGVTATSAGVRGPLFVFADADAPAASSESAPTEVDPQEAIVECVQIEDGDSRALDAPIIDPALVEDIAADSSPFGLKQAPSVIPEMIHFGDDGLLEEPSFQDRPDVRAVADAAEPDPCDEEPQENAPTQPISAGIDAAPEELFEDIHNTGLTSARFFKNWSVPANAPQPPAEPAPKKIPPGAAPEAAADYPETIAAYMERLLGKKVPGTPAATPTEPGPAADSSLSTMTRPQSSPVPTVPADYADGGSSSARTPRPRSTTDSVAIRANMDSMRQLANITARTAIAASTWKRFRGSRMMKALLAGAACATFLALICSPSLFGRDMSAVAWPALAIAAVATLDFIRSILGGRTRVSSDSAGEEQSQKPSEVARQTK